MHQDIRAIIVSWNTRDLTLKSISCAINSGLQAENISVIDNCSSDDSAEAISRIYPQVDIHVMSQNLGFGGANNIGFKSSRENLVLLLNSDAFLTREALEKLINHLMENPKTGCIGCQLVGLDGRHQVGDAGFFPSLQTITNFSFFMGKISETRFPPIFLQSDLSSQAGAVSVDWVCGACMLFKRDAINDPLLFPSDIFMYGEDIDLCLRIKKAGWNIDYLPQLKITHIGGASGNGVSTAWISAIMSFIAKHQGKLARDLSVAVLAFGFTIRIGAYLILGKLSNAIKTANFLRALLTLQRKI